MSMRLKAALVIVSIVLVVVAASFFSNYFFTRKSIVDSMTRDVTFACDIADRLVVTKLSDLTSQVTIEADSLREATSDGEMSGIMALHMEKYPDFLGRTVIKSSDDVLHYGKTGTPGSAYMGSEYYQLALDGECSISTTYLDAESGEIVMYVAVPMGEGRTYVAALPGMIFSSLISDLKLWETGNIFIIDSEGTMIANFRDFLVLDRRNFIEDAKTDPEYVTSGAFYQRMITSENGLGYYIYDGVERMCVYRRVSGSMEGWRIAVVVLLSESPEAGLQRGLLTSAILFLCAGMIGSIYISKFAAKPYVRIQVQNNSLVELNDAVKAQSAKIQETHERTKLLLDAMPFTVQLWDKNFNLFDCNEAVCKEFQVGSKVDFIEHFADFSPECQANGKNTFEMFTNYLLKAFESGKCEFEWMHQLRDGTQIPCDMTLVRIKYNDGDIVAAYAWDLRAQKQMMAEKAQLQKELEDALREAQDANRAKSNFLANMSHEMRTPLNAVIGLSELVLDNGNIDTEVKGNLEKISNAGSTLLRTVNDILDLSKIEAGRLELVPIVYDLPSLINDTVTQNILRIGEKPIEFVLDIDESLPTQLFGDELRVRQILNNILSNACKYTKSGTIELGMRCVTDGDVVWMTAWVRDTGIGIRSEDMEKLFAEYNQVDARSNRKIEGTGLGLAITRKMAEMMDGSVNVESVYGRGSQFTIKLKQLQITDETIDMKVIKNLQSLRYTDHKRKTNAKIKRVSMPDAHILVVDDVATNLDVAKGMMKPYGMHIDCVSSGQKAIDAIRAEKVKYNAIFMDHMMPEMDGIEAVRIIREEIGTEYAKNVPIIALTANAIIGSEDMFLSNGFQAFISKPIEMNRLDAVIKKWVRGNGKEEPAAEEAAKQKHIIPRWKLSGGFEEI